MIEEDKVFIKLNENTRLTRTSASPCFRVARVRRLACRVKLARLTLKTAHVFVFSLCVVLLLWLVGCEGPKSRTPKQHNEYGAFHPETPCKKDTRRYVYAHYVSSPPNQIIRGVGPAATRIPRGTHSWCFSSSSRRPMPSHTVVVVVQRWLK